MTGPDAAVWMADAVYLAIGCGLGLGLIAGMIRSSL